MFSYFVFNGVNSRDKGIYLASAPVIMRGKERVTSVMPLGRSGSLTLAEGEDVYEPYTLSVVVRSKDPAPNVYSWLRGEGYVTFSGEPDKKQLARVINQAQFKRVSTLLEWWEAQIAFTCQPLKELLHEPEYTVINGASLVNLGDTAEKPLFTLQGAYGDLSVAIGTTELRIAGLPQELGGCVIDCDALSVLSYDKTQLITNLSSGDFPTVPKHATATLSLTGSHLGTVRVRRRQRWV